jgi:hypothetical protein
MLQTLATSATGKPRKLCAPITSDWMHTNSVGRPQLGGLSLLIAHVDTVLTNLDMVVRETIGPITDSAPGQKQT